MKKQYLVYILIASLGLLFGYTMFMPNEIADAKKNPIAIMLQNDGGTYDLSTSDSLLPGAMYVFNSNLSSCNGNLTINYLNGQVNVEANGNGNCTLYYDKKAPSITINNLTVNGTSTSSFPTDTNYTVSANCSGATATWNYTKWGLDISGVSSQNVTCTLAFTTKSETNSLKDYVISQVNQPLGSGTVVEEVNTVGSKTFTSYRYEGKNPTNYVKFNNELWRIVGVFDATTSGNQAVTTTKIMRVESLPSLAYDTTSGTKSWYNSTLRNLLNNSYYNSLDANDQSSCLSTFTTKNQIKSNCDYTNDGIKRDFRSMILNIKPYDAKASVGSTAEGLFTSERNQSLTDASYVHLLYASDFAYGVLSSSCDRTITTDLYNVVECSGNNWLLDNNYEYTMTQEAGESKKQLQISSLGTIASVGYQHGMVRPVVYLKTSAYIISGTGTEADPFVING